MNPSRSSASTWVESTAAGHGSTQRQLRRARARAGWITRRARGHTPRRRLTPVPSRARLADRYIRQREEELGPRGQWSAARRRNVSRGALTFALTIQQDALRLRLHGGRDAGTTGPQRARGLARAGRQRVPRTVRRHRALAQQLGILRYHHVRRRRHGLADYVLILPGRGRACADPQGAYPRRQRGMSTCPTGSASSALTGTTACAAALDAPPESRACGARRPPPRARRARSAHRSELPSHRSPVSEDTTAGGLPAAPEVPDETSEENDLELRGRWRELADRWAAEARDRTE